MNAGCGLSPDVLCVGHASYDLVFEVGHHPEPDEKIFASAMTGFGGGPAANAAVTVARLGLRSAFAGYLGLDVYGQSHLAELEHDAVDISRVVRGDDPTPLSVILVKPDGRRALVNYKGLTRALAEDSIDFSDCLPKVVLLDGHEPNISRHWVRRGVPTVLDAGSLHAGTEELMFSVDFLVASEKFASQWLGRSDADAALHGLAEKSANVVITLGEKGLIWRRGSEHGSVPAFPVKAVDTTGAGDAFHGAFAAGLAAGFEWEKVLSLASAVGAFCCTRVGARAGIPFRIELDEVPGFVI